MSGYAGTEDKDLSEGSPNLAVDNYPDMYIKATGGPGNHGLLMFSNLVGVGANQIPTGSIINSVSLKLNVLQASSNTIEVHRQLLSWGSATTWNSAGAGIQINDVEAVLASDASFVGSSTGVVKIGRASCRERV